MRKILRAIFAAMGRIVVRTVRLAGGVVMTFVEMLRPSTPPVDYDDAIVDDAVSRVEDVRARDTDLEILREGGELIRRAASQRIQFGQVVDTSIPVGIRNWINGLPRDELAILVASTAEDVARHVMGQITLRDANGIAIGRPDERRDAAATEEKRAASARREAGYSAASRRRQPDIGPSPSFGF